MQKEKYECPEFDFQEMRLTERVADTCWGYKKAWWDEDKDNAIDDGEEIIDLGVYDGNCAAVEDALKNFFSEKGIDGSDDKHFCSTNTQSDTVRYIPS